MDRGMADRLCLGAAEDRESWQSGVERDAEAAAHTDNLVPAVRTRCCRTLGVSVAASLPVSVCMM